PLHRLATHPRFHQGETAVAMGGDLHRLPFPGLRGKGLGQIDRSHLEEVVAAVEGDAAAAIGRDDVTLREEEPTAGSDAPAGKERSPLRRARGGGLGRGEDAGVALTLHPVDPAEVAADAVEVEPPAAGRAVAPDEAEGFLRRLDADALHAPALLLAGRGRAALSSLGRGARGALAADADHRDPAGGGAACRSVGDGLEAATAVGIASGDET